jgi:hypothetical protein
MAKVADVLDGLAILHKYKRDGICDAQHDVLYADGPKPDDLETVDRAVLATLGWAYDGEASSWRRFT